MNKKLIDKLNKLFAVAEKSTFPEEAANALGKAQALMTQHKISMEMLQDTSEQEEEIVSFRDDQLNREDKNKVNLASWKSNLSHILAIHNGCFVFLSGPKIVITGKPSNVSSVRYLYMYCVKEINRLTKLNCTGKGRTFSNNFRYGCVRAIEKAIQDEKDEIRNKVLRDSKQLVIVDKVLSQYREDTNLAKIKAYAEFNLKGRSQSSGRLNSSGLQAGFNAGKNIYKGNRTRALSAPQKKIGFTS